MRLGESKNKSTVRICSLLCSDRTPPFRSVSGTKRSGKENSYTQLQKRECAREENAVDVELRMEFEADR